MKIQVLYFAALREALGIEREVIETDARTIAELRAQLCARGDAYAHGLAPGRNVRAALNQVMAAPETRLAPDAEVAFFPPVTGG
jgi:sulfur-carrier protein